MSQQRIERTVGVQTTTGAVTVVVCSVPLPDGCSVSASGVLVGRETTSAAAASIRKSALLKRVAGTASLVGSVLDTITGIADTALATASGTIAISGSSAELRVTGVVGQTVEWTGELTAWMG